MPCNLLLLGGGDREPLQEEEEVVEETKMRTIDHSTAAITAMEGEREGGREVDDLMASMAVMDRMMKQSHERGQQGGQGRHPGRLCRPVGQRGRRALHAPLPGRGVQGGATPFATSVISPP